MVKCTLSGKQTTTRAMGAKIAQWIIQAGCGVAVLIGGKLVTADIVVVNGLTRCDDGDVCYPIRQVRIHRATVSQIRELINV